MKIEKVNENQIRCTLTREDLASREIKISELAYGSEKAKNLFRDMMRQANFEFGFEAEDIPLMIEAIPLNAECIVLIITKVEDPEELDTRFARFAPSVTEDMEEDAEEESAPEAPYFDKVADLFHRVQDAGSDEHTQQMPVKESKQEPDSGREKLTRVFLFRSLQQVMNVCQLISHRFEGASILYKDSRTGNYYLLLAEGDGNGTDFDRCCNIASEYGSVQHRIGKGKSFLSEHLDVLISENAVQALGNNG